MYVLTRGGDPQVGPGRRDADDRVVRGAGFATCQQTGAFPGRVLAHELTEDGGEPGQHHVQHHRQAAEGDGGLDRHRAPVVVADQNWTSKARLTRLVIMSVTSPPLSTTNNVVASTAAASRPIAYSTVDIPWSLVIDGSPLRVVRGHRVSPSRPTSPAITGAIPRQRNAGRKHNPSGPATSTPARCARASDASFASCRTSSARSEATAASSVPDRAARRALRARAAVRGTSATGRHATVGSAPSANRSAVVRSAVPPGIRSATTRTAVGTGIPARRQAANRSHPAASRSGSSSATRGRSTRRAPNQAATDTGNASDHPPTTVTSRPTGTAATYGSTFSLGTRILAGAPRPSTAASRL